MDMSIFHHDGTCPGASGPTVRVVENAIDSIVGAIAAIVDAVGTRIGQRHFNLRTRRLEEFDFVEAADGASVDSRNTQAVVAVSSNGA